MENWYVRMENGRFNERGVPRLFPLLLQVGSQSGFKLGVRVNQVIINLDINLGSFKVRFLDKSRTCQEIFHGLTFCQPGPKIVQPKAVELLVNQQFIHPVVGVNIGVLVFFG